MSSERYPAHRYASALPLMIGPEYDALVADIKANGLRHPIVLCPDDEQDDVLAILDGRNRERACDDAGVKRRYERFQGDDPLAYVVSVNIRRRHLNESQRGLVADRLAKLTQGRPSKTGSAAGLTQAAAAELVNVSERTVRSARAVQKDAIPEVVAAIEQGELLLERATEIAKLEKDQQLDALNEAKNTTRTTSKEQRDAMMSIAVLLKESEVMALRTLCEAGEWYAERDARAREGVRVLKRLAPVVGR